MKVNVLPFTALGAKSLEEALRMLTGGMPVTSAVTPPDDYFERPTGGRAGDVNTDDTKPYDGIDVPLSGLEQAQHDELDTRLAQDIMLYKLLLEVGNEVRRARSKHGPMHSPHEGYAVLLEEVEELWDTVMRDAGRGASAREEAVQIAAMAVRYIQDVCLTPPTQR